MVKSKLKKTMSLIVVCTALTGLSGCAMDDIFNSNDTNVQTKENGEKKEKKSYAQSKTEGYDVTYSGMMSGYSKDIIVYGETDKVERQGAGVFEWITDDMVKVTFDKNKDEKSEVIIVSEDRVCIHLTQDDKSEKLEEEKKISNNK